MSRAVVDVSRCAQVESVDELRHPRSSPDSNFDVIYPNAPASSRVDSLAPAHSACRLAHLCRSIPIGSILRRHLNRLSLDLRILSDRLPFYFARQLNQFGDLADLFLEWQMCESLTNFRFHFVGNFKL